MNPELWSALARVDATRQRVVLTDDPDDIAELTAAAKQGPRGGGRLMADDDTSPGTISQSLSDAQFHALIENSAAGKWWLLGYEAGVRDGHGLGMDEANQMWTDVTTLACRTGAAGGPAFTEVKRRRTENARPPLSAEEIRAKAEASWAEFEATIRKAA